MKIAKIVIPFLLALFCLHFTNGWSRRRCTPRACEVSSWTYWSSCTATECGVQGFQRRLRWKESLPSCGGAECPVLEETRQCSSGQSVDCQLSSWSEWSTCSTPCRVSGIQTSTRYKVITEQCGGICSSTLRKTRGCPGEKSCLNGGGMNSEGTCVCKKGFSGDCCEQEGTKTAVVAGGVSGSVVFLIILCVIYYCCCHD